MKIYIVELTDSEAAQLPAGGLVELIANAIAVDSNVYDAKVCEYCGQYPVEVGRRKYCSFSCMKRASSATFQLRLAEKQKYFGDISEYNQVSNI